MSGATSMAPITTAVGAMKTLSPIRGRTPRYSSIISHSFGKPAFARRIPTLILLRVDSYNWQPKMSVVVLHHCRYRFIQ